MTKPKDHWSIRRLPLLPLVDEVHFPCTELQLRIVEPEYRALVEEIFIDQGTEAHVGTVLLKPEWAQDGETDVFSYGTAGRLLGLEMHDEGCDVILSGEYRFEVQRELEIGPCRSAVVRPLPENKVSESDPMVCQVRRDILGYLLGLTDQLGEGFVLQQDQVLELNDDDLPFETMVNLLAANLDLAPLSKLSLLNEALLDRSYRLLAILRSRYEVVEALEPFRHLAAAAEYN